MRPDLQIDGTEVMWLEIKTKVGIILLNIIYRSPTEAGPLFWNSYRKMVSDALDCSSKIISLGDYNVDFLRQLHKEVDDIIHVYGLENKISDHDPTYIVVDCGYKNSKSYTRTF